MKHDACNCSGFPISIKASEAEKNILAKQEKKAAAQEKLMAPPVVLNIPAGPRHLEVTNFPAPVSRDDIGFLFEGK